MLVITKCGMYFNSRKVLICKTQHFPSSETGDLEAVSGSGENCKRARKKLGRRKVKNERKSPFLSFLTFFARIFFLARLHFSPPPLTAPGSPSWMAIMVLPCKIFPSAPARSGKIRPPSAMVPLWFRAYLDPAMTRSP